MLEQMPKSWMFLHYLKLALACAVLAALAGVAIQATLLLHAATVAARALPVAVRVELQATRTALLAEVRAGRRDLAGQVESTRKDLLGRTERQVAALRTDVMGELAQIRAPPTGASATPWRASMLPSGKSRNYTPISTRRSSMRQMSPSKWDDAAPLFLDCEYNPDCVFNRYVGASKGIERAAMNFGQMSSDVRGAASPKRDPRRRYPPPGRERHSPVLGTDAPPAASLLCLRPAVA